MRKLMGGCGLGVMVAALVLASTAGATVTLTTSRTDVLYTSTPEDEIDCGALARSMDADLPYNVTRIRADDSTGQATSFQWKLPKPNVGFLLRDDPTIESSAGGAFAVQAFCAEVGSGCILTKETIKTYRLPTVLYAGPTCDTGFPSKTREQFGGDTVRIRAKAVGQKGKAAKGTVDVGYGRLGTPVLWVSDDAQVPKTGIGTDKIPTVLVPVFSVTLESTIVPPLPIKEYFFDNGAGQDATVPEGCQLRFAADGAAACTSLLYEGAGTYQPHVEVRLDDDSAYCDNATVRVVTCQPKTRLDVDRIPKKSVYKSGDGEPEQIVVTLHNQAPRNSGCDFIFERMTCETAVKRGSFDESEMITFTPAVCDSNPAIFCSNDLECGVAGPCVNASHCSGDTEQLCTTDMECSTSVCPTCEADERCIRVIQMPGQILPGESVELLNEMVDLRSVLPGAAKITETWSVKELFDRGNAAKTERYKIRGEQVP